MGVISSITGDGEFALRRTSPEFVFRAAVENGPYHRAEKQDRESCACIRWHSLLSRWFWAIAMLRGGLARSVGSC